MERPSFPWRGDRPGGPSLGLVTALLALLCQLVASPLSLARAADASLAAAFDQAAIPCGAGHAHPRHHRFPQTALGAFMMAPIAVLTLASGPGPIPRTAIDFGGLRHGPVAASLPPPAHARTSFARAPPVPA